MIIIRNDTIIILYNLTNKEDMINKGEHRSKNVTPTAFKTRKQLKAWLTIPIPKQIEDDERDKK